MIVNVQRLLLYLKRCQRRVEADTRNYFVTNPSIIDVLRQFGIDIQFYTSIIARHEYIQTTICFRRTTDEIGIKPAIKFVRIRLARDIASPSNYVRHGRQR